MERRQLLKMVPALSAGIVIGKPAFGIMTDLSQANGQSTSDFFAQAKSQSPELIGFENVASDFARSELKVEGKIPADLQGNYYRNGPAKHERGDVRYRHLFEGDGMLQHFQIAGGKVIHRGRFIETPKYQQEQAAGRFLYSGPDTKIADAKAAVSSDTINTANTNVIPVGNDLWALWEAGSASKINEQTLDFLEYVDLGKTTRFESKLKGLPFSAHPKVEPNGEIWNFGLHSSGSVILYHLRAAGAPKNVGIINSRYKGGMLHDFLITDKHVLLILPSLKRNLNAEKSAYFSSIEFAPKQAMRVLVIDKTELKVKREYEFEPGFAFHFGNAWEDKLGDIYFDISLYPNVDILYQLSNLMQGDVIREAARAKTVLVTLKVNGQVKQQLLADGTEFPKVHADEVGKYNEQLFFISGNVNSVWSHAVNVTNHQTGKTETFDYGSDYLIEEHVPIKTDQGKQYLIGTALHIAGKRTCLNIFNADAISDGPIARAWLSHHLPIGFHGCFKLT